MLRRRSHVLLRQGTTTSVLRSPSLRPNAKPSADDLIAPGNVRFFFTRLSRIFGIGASPERRRTKRRVSIKKPISRVKAPSEEKSFKPARIDVGTTDTLERLKPERTRRVMRPAQGRSLAPPSVGLQPHHDLRSYIRYAEARGLLRDTTAFKGTSYEYTALETLQRLPFTLRRTGRTNDLGIDLQGHLKVPKFLSSWDLPVVLQCKNTTPDPDMVRALEGSISSAGMGSKTVAAFLVCPKPATAGVVGAVHRSRDPVGFMHISSEGDLLQLFWNSVADEIGLNGLKVVYNYGRKGLVTPGSASEEGGARGIATLHWHGRPWEKK